MTRTALLVTVLIAAVAACSSTPVAPTPDDGGAPPPAGDQQGCSRTSVNLAPLSDLTAGAYQGEPGGLYPGRSNTMPASHLSAGLELARGIEPLDAQGMASPSGRYVFISIGMSNTTQEFSAFVPLASADASRDPRLTIVDGAQGGQTAADWANPACQCWTRLDGRLQQANVSAAQVAVAWIKLANRQPSEGWPTHARRLKDDTVIVLERLKARFPNLRLAYFSSRIYAGYATTTLNPEPYAYQSGFSVRWTIEDQLNGGLSFSGAHPRSPWIAWAPYLWADGVRPRSDGLTWACSDLAADGTHPSTVGRQKVAQQLLDFVRTDATAREWYLK
jgi:lysophospholipase L1-like esterase